MNMVYLSVYSGVLISSDFHLQRSGLAPLLIKLFLNTLFLLRCYYERIFKNFTFGLLISNT